MFKEILPLVLLSCPNKDVGEQAACCSTLLADDAASVWAFVVSL
jgi:hypothetical protein